MSLLDHSQNFHHIMLFEQFCTFRSLHKGMFKANLMYLRPFFAMLSHLCVCVYRYIKNLNCIKTV